MYPGTRHAGPPGPQPGQGQYKFSVQDSCERIKDEFAFLQSQYHALKLELEKLANEKTDMQRHYVMYYEMSYGLNVEMHKQTEIAKRLNNIIAQILPFLSSEHQAQVATAVERAKQVTMADLNNIIGQQMHAGQLPAAAAHGHGPPLPMMPHAAAAAAMAAGLQPPMPSSTAPGLLALSSSLGGGGGPGGPHLPGLPPVTLSSSSSASSLKDHRSDDKRSNSAHSAEERSHVSC